MIPTFDLYNVIRGSVRVALAAITSPLGIMLGVSVASGALLSSISAFAFNAYFSDFSLEQFYLFSDNSGITQLALFCVNSPLLISVFESFLTLLIWGIPFVMGFLGGVWAFMATRSIIRAHRQTVKDVVG